MKKILLIILTLFSIASYSQVKQVYPQYGGTWKKLYLTDSGAFRLPIKIASTKDFNSSTPDSGQIYYDPIDSSVKVWTGTQWMNLGGSGGGTWGTITGTLSDQTDLQSALDSKLNISDTSTMLSNYLNNVAYGLLRTGQTARFDSATVFTQLRETILTNTDSLFGVQDNTATQNRDFNLNGGGRHLQITTTAADNYFGLFDNSSGTYLLWEYTFTNASNGRYAYGNLVPGDNQQYVSGSFGSVNYELNAAGVTPYFEVNVNGSGSVNTFIMKDSMSFLPSLGKINIDSLRNGSTFSVNKLLGWRDDNGVVGYITPASPITLTSGILGADTSILATLYDLTQVTGSQALQQVFDIETGEASLNKNDTINIGSNTFHIRSATNGDVLITSVSGNVTTTSHVTGTSTVQQAVNSSNTFQSNATLTTGGYTVFSQITNAGQYSDLNINPDSILFKPNAGRITIDSLRSTATDTAGYKPMVWNIHNKSVRYFNSWAEIGIGGTTSLSSAGGGLDVQTGGVGSVRTLSTNDHSVSTNLISIKKQMSITGDASGLKLDGDQATPGNNKIYGTDGSGDKGWQATVAYNFSGLADWDLLRYNSSSSEFVNYKSTFTANTNPAIKVLVRDTVTGEQYHTTMPTGTGSIDSLLYMEFQTSQYDSVPQAGTSYMVIPEIEDEDDVTVYREGSFQHTSLLDGVYISNDTLYLSPALSDSERVNVRINKARPVRRLGFASLDYLLDDFPSSLMSFSLRKLSSSYAGDAIRVRRSSDDAEQDIGFVSGELDVASLTSFVGGGNGLIVTWYDQSGNANNATQSTHANQPVIVSSGSVIYDNGKPTIDFGDNATAYYLVLPTGLLNGATSLSYFHVAKISNYLNSNAGVFGPSTTNSLGLEILQLGVISRVTALRFNGGGIRNDNVAAGYYLWVDGSQSLSSIFGNASSTAAYKNSAAVTLTDASAMPSLNFNGIYAIGLYNSTTTDMNGFMQELIIYTSDKTSSRTGIEANINAFYTIY